ncbi:Malate/L-lactate dehydrogenase [Schizothecium vesticola]|uniref:Malate/L-lactate dehydrogenase n=1 Tax=Schizothecium vesticola TaxID=314040 RepID=A0AA40K289_9PEZI|nr:Malate/L-lactate dehydrogenase [Schizothecium vesticola]
MADPQTPVLVRHEDAETFATNLLIAAGVPPAPAAITASALVEADLRGVESHGINRLPSYLARMRHGVLDPAASPTLVHLTPAVAQINAHNTLGFPAAALAIDTAVSLASTSGIGLVSVTASNHFGMAAWLVRRAATAGFLSLVFTTASPALAPWGGRVPLLGIAPLACGAPGSPHPFILDMAPSVAARGRIHRALRRGEAIPVGWALDKEGRETEDPAAALDGGVMMPVGGPKGVGLAVMMEVLAGVMTGAGFAGGVVGPGDVSRPAGVGHLVVAMRADLFVSAEEFRERMGVLWGEVVGAERREGVDRIWFPGEREQVCEERRREGGIPYVRGEVEVLNEEARRLGVEGLREMVEGV